MVLTDLLANSNEAWLTTVPKYILACEKLRQSLGVYLEVMADQQLNILKPIGGFSFGGSVTDDKAQMRSALERWQSYLSSQACREAVEPFLHSGSDKQKWLEFINSLLRNSSTWVEMASWTGVFSFDEPCLRKLNDLRTVEEPQLWKSVGYSSAVQRIRHSVLHTAMEHISNLSPNPIGLFLDVVMSTPEIFSCSCFEPTDVRSDEYEKACAIMLEEYPSLFPASGLEPQVTIHRHGASGATESSDYPAALVLFSPQLYIACNGQEDAELQPTKRAEQHRAFGKAISEFEVALAKCPPSCTDSLRVLNSAILSRKSALKLQQGMIMDAIVVEAQVSVEEARKHASPPCMNSIFACTAAEPASLKQVQDVFKFLSTSAGVKLITLVSMAGESITDVQQVISLLPQSEETQERADELDRLNAPCVDALSLSTLSQVVCRDLDGHEDRASLYSQLKTYLTDISPHYISKEPGANNKLAGVLHFIEAKDT